MKKQASQTPLLCAITGTKGKTTVTRILAHCMHELGYNTLSVDTDGHYVNGKQKSTREDSSKLNGLYPTVVPGKYLYELRGKEKPVAILESSISCAIHGVGYWRHQVGIFTNVYEDHIGFHITSKHDLAKRKASFILKKIKPNGTAVINGDDPYITKFLNLLPNPQTQRVIPVGLDFTSFDIATHLKQGGIAVTYRDYYVGILSKQGFTRLVDVRKLSWTFNGTFMPSLYNVMSVVAGLQGLLGEKRLTKRHVAPISTFAFKDTGGRLVQLENKRRDIRVILDYAHETRSMSEMALLLKGIARNKTIGIIRFAGDRSDEALKKSARALANKFDIAIIYDKIDGIKRKELKSISGRYHRKVGDVSTIIADTMSSYTKLPNTVIRVLTEEEAVKHAKTLLSKGDVVAYISDEHTASLRLAKKHLIA